MTIESALSPISHDKRTLTVIRFIPFIRFIWHLSINGVAWIKSIQSVRPSQGFPLTPSLYAQMITIRGQNLTNSLTSPFLDRLLPYHLTSQVSIQACVLTQQCKVPLSSLSRSEITANPDGPDRPISMRHSRYVTISRRLCMCRLHK